MHFLSEKMKSMLQNKQGDQFDFLRLTHVVDVVSVDVLLPLSGKSGKKLKMKRKISMSCKQS